MKSTAATKPNHSDSPASSESLLDQGILGLNESDFITLINQASKNIENRANYRSKKMACDKQFLTEFQDQLETIEHKSLSHSRLRFLARVSEYFYQNMENIVKEFRLEYAIKGQNPSSAELLDFILEKRRSDIIKMIPVEISCSLPDDFSISTFFRKISHFTNFESDRPVDILDLNSSRAFYGQLLSTTTGLFNPSLNPLKNSFKTVPEGNLAVINLNKYPEVLSEMNIYAMRQRFNQLINQSVSSEQQPAGGAFARYSREFIDFILQNYLQPVEQQDLQKKLRYLGNLPEPGLLDPIREFFHKPTRRRFMELFPPNRGDVGQQVFERLKPIYFLEIFASQNNQKDDHQLAREIAFLIQSNLIEEIPGLNLQLKQQQQIANPKLPR